jgi:periplasmic copper chaperone A
MRCLPVRLAAAAATAILSLIGTIPVGAAQKAPSASEGWVKLSPADAAIATAFAVVDNPTMYDVYLVSASSDVAAEVMFGDASPAAAATQATPKEVTAPAYGRVELKPDGVHLVLKGLKRALKAGETVSITLVTDGGVSIPVAAIVKTQ